MPGDFQPLQDRNPIAKPDGTPTDYFIRWAQQRQIDIGSGITAAQAEQLITDWAAAREIIAGLGLSGGGNLSSDVTIDLQAGIDDLTDVDTASTAPTDGQALIWDSATELWIPGTVSGGGGSGGIEWSVTATGTGSSQNINIPYLSLDDEQILVFVNGLKIPPSGYTLAGRVVTITTGSGDDIEIVGPVGDPPVPASATDWRVYVTTYQGGALVSVAEIYLYTDAGVVPGSDVATTSTPTMSSEYLPVFGPANFIDRDFNSFSSLQLSSPLPGWYAMQLPAAESIVGFGLMGRAGELDNTPKDFSLQYYDGTTWVDYIGAVNQTGWGVYERRDFFF